MTSLRAIRPPADEFPVVGHLADAARAFVYRALAWAVAGHEVHHRRVLHERDFGVAG